MIIQPTGDNILVEIIEVKEVGGIVLPDNMNTIEERATVIRAGKDVKNIHAGDKIYFKSWALDTVILNQGTSNEEKISFIKEKRVLAFDKAI